MFELDKAIADWRRQMIAEGIKTPVLLDELESHLQEDVECQVRAGTNVEQAFHAAVRRLGQSSALTDEFSKVGETNEAFARIKYFFLTLAGIQNPSLATNMNTSLSNGSPEPAWATYLKSGAFVLPATILWLLISVFVFPKFNEVLTKSGLQLPGFLSSWMGLILFLRQYLIVIGAGFMVAVALLEWRSHKWPRYRRATFGVGAFLLNSVVLISISVMVVLALVAGPLAAHHVK